ncbi:hypothetical protein [Clostridium polynesiense]|uniref:hypothetical protein n=1 Tax=Clostridium polynesiense TaxID=1325933 RepID=UPI00058B5F81|nr:hypothetical protein [Clostridium polynesiense]
MSLVLQIIGILFMLTFMFVGIWGFILANQAYSQLRYQNYLLEKLTQNVYMLTCKKDEKASETANNKTSQDELNNNFKNDI